jgi:rhamnosyltransferase
LIEQAADACSHVLVESTSKIEELNPLPKNVEIIERSNIGYDFCSYRLGIEQSLNSRSFDRLVLANNSCFYGRNFNLKSVFAELEKRPEDICGITANAQFSPHLQSSFLYFKKSALLTNWFNEFWSLVQPLSSKDQLIFNYEIGLTSTATSRGLSCESLFGSPIPRAGEKASFVKKLIGCFSERSTQSKENPFFEHPSTLYRKFGILKWEFIKKNYRQNSLVWSFLSPEDRTSISAHFTTNNSQAHSKFDQRFDTNASANDWLGPIAYQKSATEKRPSIGVVLHLFYPELLQEIIEQIALIPEKFDLIVTVTNLETGLFARCMIREKLLLEPIVVIVENRGRDVLPFVHLINRGLLENYEIVCKIHSKKSLYSEKGSQWRQEILTELLGTKSNLISILNEFRTNPKIGIFGPSKTYLTQPEYWGANRERLQSLAAKLRLTNGEIQLRFFAGTMFWIRSTILKRIADLKLTPEDFEEECGQQDGTLAHAIERLFLILSEQCGFHGRTCGQQSTELTHSSENRPIVYQ